MQPSLLLATIAEEAFYFSMIEIKKPAGGAGAFAFNRWWA